MILSVLFFSACTEPSGSSATSVPLTSGQGPFGAQVGNYLVLWGGTDGGTTAADNAGGQLDLATSTWSPMSTTNAPAPRIYHSVVGTPTEMIAFGGWSPGEKTLGTGGRYNPATQTWTATSTVNAPAPRLQHTAVWTGTRMLVWGGSTGIQSGPLATGGRYDPATDTWTPISTVNAPSARYAHMAVWTGTRMIVWGGVGAAGSLNTGGQYDPVADAWTPLSTANAPAARSLGSAVWTGSRMIVWGGQGATQLNTGGLYDPVADKARQFSGLTRRGVHALSLNPRRD